MAIHLKEDIHQLINSIERKANGKAKSLLGKMEGSYDFADDKGFTLLHHSVQYNNETIVQHLIELGCNVNAQNKAGYTPLMLAVNEGNPSIVKMLLENNADIHFITNRSGISSLQLACHKFFQAGFFYSENSVSYIILQSLIDTLFKHLSKKKNMLMSLLLAHIRVKLAIVALGNVELVKCLLENGYSVNDREPIIKSTALHWAIVMRKFENAKILIEHGANVNLVDARGHSPLYYYAANMENVDEKSEILFALLKARYNASNRIDRKNFKEEVEYLLKKGNKKTVKEILNRRNDLGSIDFDFSQPLLHILLENENDNVWDLVEELDMKFNMNVWDQDSFTPLMLAVSSASLKKVEFLLKHGADVNLKPHNCKSVLFQLLEMLLYNMPDKQENAVKIVELLLQNGADAQYFYYTSGFQQVTILDEICYAKDILEKVFVSHYAFLGSLDDSRLTVMIRDKINSNPVYKTLYDFYVIKLEEMKEIEINKITTLYKLFTEEEDKILGYARRQDFILEFNAILDRMSPLQSYYSNTLRRRIDKVVGIIELEREGAATIKILSGLCDNAYHYIVYKIINFLSIQDLKKLCQVVNDVKYY